MLELSALTGALDTRPDTVLYLVTLLELIAGAAETAAAECQEGESFASMWTRVKKCAGHGNSPKTHAAIRHKIKIVQEYFQEVPNYEETNK